MNDLFGPACIGTGIFIANIAGGMNLPDFLIIYLACGAPFGVYYFLQNRNRTETKFLFLQSVFRFVFWIPFALQMVARKSLFTKLYNNNFDARAVLDAKKELRIEEIKKYFENVLARTDSGLSIYEFRETFDRYVGLSAEVFGLPPETTAAEKEIYRITNHTSKKVGEICLNRRNRQRLSFHQKLARRDFLEVFGRLSADRSEAGNLSTLAAELAEIVRDSEAPRALEKLSAESLQTGPEKSVRNLEQELWKLDRHKPLTDQPISTSMQVMTATGKLSRKD